MKTIQVPINLAPSAARALKSLSKRTRISQQAHLREAVADLLKKYQREAHA
jgi:hypothetical protein